jgi:hypothetical protein
MKTSINILALVERLAAAEATQRFVAPCAAGGGVRASVEGLVQTFSPQPARFVGWGVFRALANGRAQLERPASRAQVERWHSGQRSVRLILLRALNTHAWLALPASATGFVQRFGPARPVAVHLVRDGAPFEQITAGFDGATFWFEGRDRRANVRLAETLRHALAQAVAPALVRHKGLTPEAREAYRAVLEGAQEASTAQAEAGAQRRLSAALSQGGGRLDGFVDRGVHWLVAWTDRDGDAQSSAIRKRDLTVLSAGICLSDLDADFDLQSLVGVVSDAEDW